MEKLLTTRDLADALGASESSLRRWTNSGAIRTARTVGGHRRIPLSEAIRFIRDTHATIVRPEALGLTDLQSRSPDDAFPESALHYALLDGNAPAARGHLLSLYLSGSPLASIFDGPLAHAMHRIGELWQHADRGVYLEHRATDICLQSVNQIRQLITAPSPSAPAAVGGAPTGDPYLLPSMMAAAVLAESGYRETNLGPQTPPEVLATAAEEQRAQIVWISASTPGDPPLRAALAHLADRLRAQSATLLLGGRHAHDLAPLESPNVHVLTSMTDLAAFAASALPPSA